MSTKGLLPFELISHVILLSSDDNSSLPPLALVNRWFHHETARHFYATSPPVKLGISLAGSPSMQFLQVIGRSAYHAALVRHFVFSIVAYDEKIITVGRALERMTNLETLEIRHLYIQAAHSLLDLTPTLFENPKCRFQLKALLWTSNRQQISLLRLGELIAQHRNSLEVLSVNFLSRAHDRDKSHDINIRIIAAMQRLPAGVDDSSPSTQPQSVSTITSLWPLPRLRALMGSQETLDIFFPLVAESNQIVKLEINSPSDPSAPDLNDAFPRLIGCMRQNPIRVLHIDFIGNMTLNLQDLTPHLPLLETLKLNHPSLQDLNEALKPLKNLRVLLMTLSLSFMDDVVPETTVQSVFTSCPQVEQVEVGIARIGDEYHLYTRWWRCKSGLGNLKNLGDNGNGAEIRSMGRFKGPSQLFLERFALG